MVIWMMRIIALILMVFATMIGLAYVGANAAVFLICFFVGSLLWTMGSDKEESGSEENKTEAKE